MGNKKQAAEETTDPGKQDSPPIKADVVTLEEKILCKVSAEIAGLLGESWGAIYAAYRKAHIESGEEDFTFGIGLGVKLQPEMAGVKVTCKLSCAVKYANETEPVVVSNQPDMFRA